MNRCIACIGMLVVFVLAGCAEPPPQNPAYQFEPPKRSLGYLEDVEPILVKRCVVCHSCYNSPCQLKLSSWDGLERGASKQKIYQASRLKSMDPSRLLIDGHSAEQWRQKGFFSVTPEGGTTEVDDSLIYMLLDHKRKSPLVTGNYFPEADDLTCAESKDELQSYLKKHPNNGMPFGFPPLSPKEFNTIVGWLTQGAQGPTPEQQAELKHIPEKDFQMVSKWETFLNNPDPKYRMTARYLYEHLFLAHISFATGTGAFYELVRSYSGPGEEIDVVATVRPYDDPGSDQFYYRFRKIYSTIVYKTHMVFPLDDRQYARIQELFIEPDWPQQPHFAAFAEVAEPGGGPRGVLGNTNPFVTFEQIPVRSRYQWLLDNARYTVMTFIRGPVCKGQVALNVINDHFWLFFLDPDYDLSVRYPGFLKLHTNNLRMPFEQGSDYRLFEVLFENPHYKWAVDYYRARQDFYSAIYPAGLEIDAIWQGERPDDQPVLTVFRHFDSASVHRGTLGKLPKTAWVIDYPLFERIYYALVAGFDVYGNAGHQLSIRLYMDALRIEGESYFLDFMPRDIRVPTMDGEWYTGVLPDKLHYKPASIPAGFPFETADPKREFIEAIVTDHLVVEDVGFDQNYLYGGKAYPDLPGSYETVEDYMDAFVAVSAPGVSFFRHVGDHNANVAWVRIKDIPCEGEPDCRKDEVISIVIDRWHDNVKFIVQENLRLNPEKDRADFIHGFIGSYPNYFLVVDAEDLPDFFDVLGNYDGGETSIKRLAKYGVNRADPEFWEVYDWFQQRFYETSPDYPGLIDLNRYFHLAVGDDVLGVQ